MPKIFMSDIDLPDLNVWLALAWENHEHHDRARRFWKSEGAPRVAFCRITMLGLLRLVTNGKVMQGHPFNPAEAWSIYRDFLGLPEVIFLGEPVGAEAQFSAYSDAADFSHNRWTDAYLAGFARAAGCRLVSFDADFHRFGELDFLHLETV